MIIIGDLQIMAQRYTDVEEARKDFKQDEVIVRDTEDNYWIIDSENFEKIEAYGYEKIDEKK
ncbi:hypothetical protein JCM19037_1739 [Geomicrobium sp. JCM 19037]|uniref:hypothetical protein n=1 Tax=unclassified Geomicrobium TaxID=2628951 RepID=UPI00045F3EAA|nr:MULTISPECIES: hypothetical protein [unclassified Geomicrobium]GAK03416.1 hypothetical protein JCM19037_1739 [Geomicrobium sp. JCM 19037]GAK12035.1 hypothetical protein JCM19039_1762 [Geomicrobium sp. JCM 19039]